MKTRVQEQEARQYFGLRPNSPIGYEELESLSNRLEEEFLAFLRSRQGREVNNVSGIIRKIKEFESLVEWLRSSYEHIVTRHRAEERAIAGVP